MTNAAHRPARRALKPASAPLARFALVLACGLALVPALTLPVALQDMTSLLEGSRAEGRWQAFLLPSPAGSIEKATIGFGKRSLRDRLPADAGLKAGNGDVYAMQAPRPVFASPDEARVTRGQKTARVLAVSPQAPPKAFSAGSILERQSLLRPSAEIVGKDVRLAFARPVTNGASAIAVAMNFSPALTPESAATVMVASLAPETRTRKAKSRPVDAVASTDVTALGYAAVEAPENPMAALFGKILRPGRKGFIPPIGRDDHGWAATPLPASAYSAKEQTCLANGIYFEARGENQTGQAAVAQVILNRVRNPTYPNTICGVVYQNKSWRNRCQFSFACDGIKDRITNKRAFSIAKRIAGEVTRGDTWIAEVGSATHYHASYVAPRWARAMKKVDKIGLHVFYRTYGGGWN